MNAANTKYTKTTGKTRPKPVKAAPKGNLGWKKNEAPPAVKPDPLLDKFLHYTRDFRPVCLVCGDFEDQHKDRKCVLRFDDSDEALESLLTTNLTRLARQRTGLPVAPGRKLRRSEEDFQAMEAQTYGEEDPEHPRTTPPPTYIRKVVPSRDGVTFTMMDLTTIRHDWR